MQAYMSSVFILYMMSSVFRLYRLHAVMVCRLKPVFHGACFEADSAPTLSAPYPRRVRPYPARIRRVQNRRRIRFKTRSMENGL